MRAFSCFEELQERPVWIRLWRAKEKAMRSDISEGGRSKIIEVHVHYFSLAPRYGKSLKYSK